MIDLSSSFRTTTVSKTLNAWILFYKTWMATENCYYKNLLKAKSIASKQVPSLGTFSAKIRTASVIL